MEIKILGSGTLCSGKERNPACYLLRSRGQLALLDCGPGCLKQLRTAAVDILQIGTIFISHFHLDHCADVLPLLMARYLQNKPANQNLLIAGPAGLKEWFAVQAKLQDSWLQERPPLIAEIEERGAQWAGYRVMVHPTLHSTHCLAYRFSGQRSFFYSADTGYDPALVAFARDADLGLLECSLPDDKAIPTHLTPTTAGRFAAEAGFKKAVLTHIYPQNDDPALAGRVAARYKGPLIVAQDFMRLTLA